MDITSIAITLVLAVLMLYLAVRLPLAIMQNLRAGHRFRQSLSGALDELRLSRMLAFLGIDRDAYLHRESALDIRRHLESCDNCDNKSTCDQTLSGDQPAEVDDLGFCANIDDLKEMRKPQ